MKKFERSLGLTAVVSISISAMLGSGIFVLPGLAISLTGPSVWFAYFLSALCILPAAISKSELATAMPTSGGTYVYLERTFGPLAGTVAGLGLWLSLLLKSSFALVGLGAYLSTIWPDAHLLLTGLICLAIITLLNIIGISKISKFLMVAIVISITCLTGLAIFSLGHLEPTYLNPFMKFGKNGMVSATALVFVSFAGVTKVAAIAEEIKNPQKNLPRGILLSLFIVTCIYCLVNYALVGNIPFEQLDGNLRPIYLLATKFGGHTLGIGASVLAIITMSSMASTGILAASRFPFAMSRDNLLPSIIGKLHKTFLTPTFSILISSLVIAATLLTLDVSKIAKFASVFMIIIYGMENLAVIVLREFRVQWYKPTFLSPLYPLPQIIGILCSSILLIPMKGILFSALLTIGVPGVFIYLFYSRKKVDRKGVIGIRGRRKDLVEEVFIGPNKKALEVIDLGRESSVVIALLGKDSRTPEVLIEMGLGLTEEGSIEVAHLTEAPEQTDLNDFAEEYAYIRSIRRRILAMAKDRKAELSFDPLVTHDISKTIYEISQRMHCQWLLMEWGGRARGKLTRDNPIGWLQGHLNCRLAIFKDTGVRYFKKIMIVLKGDANDQLVVETADQLAIVHKASLTLVNYYDKSLNSEQREEIEKRLNQAIEKASSNPHTISIHGKNKLETLISTTAEFDLLLIGSPKYSFWTDLFGSDEEKLISYAACSVMSVDIGKK